MSKQVRQGDCLLIPIASIPTDAKLINTLGKVILAHGESSGHHHRFEGAHGVSSFSKDGDDIAMSGGTSLRGGATDVAFITVPKGGADLVHEEHSTISVSEGTYQIVRQREFSVLEGIRRVAD